MRKARMAESPRDGERARTIIGTCSPLRVGILGEMAPLDRHLVETDGSILGRASVLAGPCVARAASGARSPLIRVLADDVTPVPQADRQRRTLDLSGHVSIVAQGVPDRYREVLRADPDEEIARFVPVSLTLHEHDPERGGPRSGVQVDVEDYRESTIDPLAGWEDEWLPHLDRWHADALGLLARDSGLADDVRARPLQVERGGLVLRCYGPTVSDLRLPFRREAACGCDAARAVHDLLAAAGRRARKVAGG